jgi:hypothetical protein
VVFDTGSSRRAIVIALGLSIFAAARAEEVRLTITADVGICAHPREVSLNTGGASSARIKGIQHYYLFDFDCRPIAGWRVESAELRLKLARGHPRRLAVCTVPVPWVEGNARAAPQEGSACLTHAEAPSRAWTPFGGTMLDATYNSPHALRRSVDARLEDDWLIVPLAPSQVEAVAAGLSYGLVLSDEKGQTLENHDVRTREQPNAKPVVIVRGAPAPEGDGQAQAPISAHPLPEAAGFDSGAIAVDTAPALALPGAVGCIVELRDSTGARVARAMTFAEPEIVFEGLAPGERYVVSARVLQDGELAPLAPVSVHASPALLLPAPQAAAPVITQPRVVTGEDGWCAAMLSSVGKIRPDASGAELLQQREKVAVFPVPVTPRNAWVGVQVVLLAPTGGAGDLTLGLTPPSRTGGEPPLPARLFRAAYVSKGEAWHEEILVPLREGEKWAIPWAKNQAPSQSCQPIFVDIWVPPGAMPGDYQARLSLHQGGREVLSVPLRLRVAKPVLPDEFHLAGDCNTYNSPAGLLGGRKEDPDRFLELERRYYRLAHAHRLTLNVLPYSQSGNVAWRGAPEIEGTGAECRVTDWSAWDDRYGPLLTGAAFSPQSGYLGPGADRPVRHMYLPFHENWPAGLAAHFTPWAPPEDYEQLRLWSALLAPIEECLDAAYAHAWTGVLEQFARHLGETYPQTPTRFQVYLNNKYYYRNRETTSGRGIGLWLLDEPMFADDFLALRYFGRLARLAIRSVRGSEARSQIDFRIDISRPGFQRDWLDGVVDLNVCADQLHAQRRMIRHRKRRFGETYWNYRDPASFGESNVSWALWPVRSYCWGAEGTLVWQTIATPSDLRVADPTALFYPGLPFGTDQPVASLRLKAWREGLQVAELLRMLRLANEWNDAQLRAWVGQVCRLDGWKEGWDPPSGAAIVTFRGLFADDVEALRRAAIAGLQAPKPPSP